ncbi:MAG: cytochrome d ubiquinol oxidase subunit II [Ferruginibacter sp.]
MLSLIIIILGTTFLLYTLLGGADFGAGIVETFAGKKEEGTITTAMAPVWEANHVWLILAVVILFTGFPQVYALLSLVLHIPLMLVLLGIIFRGSAFIFRQYDVVQDNSHKYYTLLFRISSFITPVFLGMVLGAMVLGRITLDHSKSFLEVFIFPWFNIFCIAMGIFSASLFAYISGIFLVGEAENDVERKMYARFSKRAMLTTMLMGLLVFGAAYLNGHNLVKEFLQSVYSIVTVFLATLLCPAIWHFLNKEKNKTLYLRVGVGMQVTLILIGWFFIQFPVLIKIHDGENLTFFNTQAPDATLKQLLIALIAGLILIVPGFIYLFRIFKIRGS